MIVQDDPEDPSKSNTLGLFQDCTNDSPQVQNGQCVWTINDQQQLQNLYENQCVQTNYSDGSFKDGSLTIRYNECLSPLSIQPVTSVLLNLHYQRYYTE